MDKLRSECGILGLKGGKLKPPRLGVRVFVGSRGFRPRKWRGDPISAEHLRLPYRGWQPELWLANGDCSARNAPGQTN
jgi:hypothetical protein